MEQELILYNSADGKSSVSLLARDGSVWLNQMQLAELFATSVPNISQHINNILKDKELTALCWNRYLPDGIDLAVSISLIYNGD